MVADAALRVAEAVQASLPDLVNLADGLHAEPELGFEEYRSAEAVASMLERHGFAVERGIAGMETAFRATRGSGELHLALMAEYDALPEVGHACGHNLIAASAVGAGIALAAVADELDLTIEVLGTPAEEGGGGKVLMIDAGLFDRVHAAMMAHPWSFDRLSSACLAVDHFDVEFSGRTAHASAAPDQGVNAADAMVIAQVAMGLLRQQLAPGDQIHGIVTLGGEAANVIPAKVTGRFMCRSTSISALDALRPRVDACFQAGALATGCELVVTELAPAYSHMEQDEELLAAYRRHAEARGRQFALDDEGAPEPTYSTDMANVSLVVPSIHPLIGIETQGAVNHQPEFAAACTGPSAETALLDAATSLALTGVDAARTPHLRERLLAKTRQGAS